MITLIFAYVVAVVFSSLFTVGIYRGAQFKDFEVFDEHPELWHKKKLSQIDDKMILWWLRYYGSYLPPYFRKPIYLCITCMGSVWSLPLAFTYTCLLLPELWMVVIVWPLMIAPVAGLNSLIGDNLMD